MIRNWRSNICRMQTISGVMDIRTNRVSRVMIKCRFWRILSPGAGRDAIISRITGRCCRRSTWSWWSPWIMSARTSGSIRSIFWRRTCVDRGGRDCLCVEYVVISAERGLRKNSCGRWTIRCITEGLTTAARRSMRCAAAGR